MRSLQTLLSEASFDTYFVQAVIKMKDEAIFTEIYNQIRAIKDVVVIKVIDDEKLNNVSVGPYNYSLLEIKFISEGTAIDTIKMIKREALKIPGLVKFHVRTKTMLKIRNY